MDSSVMATDDESLLASLTKRLMDEERVYVWSICQYGGIRRNIVYLILNGTTREPKRRTLRGLAIGLATNPRTAETDYQKASRIFRQLNQAVGHTDDDSQALDALLPLALVPIFAKHSKAAAWEQYIVRRADLTAQEIMALDAKHLGPDAADTTTA
jgi:hypothetical protein